MADNHDLYRRWIGELWAGDYGVAAEIVAPDFVGHWPDRDISGTDELIALIRQTRDMLSDLAFVVEVGPLVEGDLVAGRWTGRGGSPDGPMSFFGNDLLRVRDGRFVEYWVASSPGTGAGSEGT